MSSCYKSNYITMEYYNDVSSDLTKINFYLNGDPFRRAPLKTYSSHTPS